MVTRSDCVRTEGLQPPSPFSVHLSVAPTSPVCVSHIQLFMTPWTVAHQAPLSVGFSRLEYWSGLPFPSPGDLPNPEAEPGSPALRADSLPSERPGQRSMSHIRAVFLPPLHRPHIFSSLSFSLLRMCRHTCLLPLWLVRPTAMIKPARVLETPEGCLTDRKVKI